GQAGIQLEEEIQAEAVKPLPTEYSLQQNYPNPFNPSTTLRYELPEPATVRLSIYNMLGQEVARLVDGNMDAGYHSVEWNSRTNSGFALPSGVYIYRMEARSSTKADSTR